MEDFGNNNAPSPLCLLLHRGLHERLGSIVKASIERPARQTVAKGKRENRKNRRLMSPVRKKNHKLYRKWLERKTTVYVDRD
jgi:hypothetical protein